MNNARSYFADKYVRIDARAHTADHAPDDELGKSKSRKLENCPDGYNRAADEDGPTATEGLTEAHGQESADSAAEGVAGDGNTCRCLLVKLPGRKDVCYLE
jgi:hypothetical protein